MGTCRRKLLEEAAERLHLSGRALHRVMRVARTVADMDAAQKIEDHHLNEALAYRRA